MCEKVESARKEIQDSTFQDKKSALHGLVRSIEFSDEDSFKTLRTPVLKELKKEITTHVKFKEQSLQLFVDGRWTSLDRLALTLYHNVLREYCNGTPSTMRARHVYKPNFPPIPVTEISLE